jgi:RPA family protein
MQERLVARKIDIKTLYTGQYIIQEGFNPNYIELNGEKISRVRILATVIDKFLSEDGNYGTITLDDGTDTIRAKAFQDLRIIEPVEKGDIIDLIGKIREYNEERYIQPEIIVKVADPNFEVLRKLELKKIKISVAAPPQKAEENHKNAPEPKFIEKEPSEKVSEEPQKVITEPQKELVKELMNGEAPVETEDYLAKEDKSEKTEKKSKSKVAAEQKKLA